MADAIGLLQSRERQAAADAVLHVLDLPLVGDDEDQVVPVTRGARWSVPLYLKISSMSGREALGVGD